MKGSITLRDSIESGIASLIKLQLANGGFQTYWSSFVDMSSPQPVDSPFITGLILDLLRYVDGVEGIREKGINYLSEARPSSGIFRFFENGIDPDLDCISLLNLILQKYRPNEFNYAATAKLIESLKQPDGSYYTWIRKTADEANENDACVGVNVLRFIIQNGKSYDTSWLVSELRNWTPGKDTLFYVQSYALIYFISQLPESIYKEIITLSGFDVTKIETGRHRDILDAAFRLIAAIKFEADARIINSLSKVIVNSQSKSGSWNSYAAFQAFNYWGSESLITAACIRALSDTVKLFSS